MTEPTPDPLSVRPRIVKVVSSPSHSPNEELHGGQEEPSLGAGDGGLEILGKAAVAVEPGEGTLDDPAAGQEFEADSVLRSLDDLDRPLAELGKGSLELWAGISAISEEVAQPWEQRAYRFDHEHCAVTVLHIGRVDLGADQQAARIGDDMAFAPPSFRWGRLCIFLPASYPLGPPLSVVLTDWLSMIPAEGLAWRPAASRICNSNSKLIRSNTPLSRQE